MDAPNFKDFIHSVAFHKCFSDVFDREFSEGVSNFGDDATAREIVEAAHKDALKSGRKHPCAPQISILSTTST